MPRVVVRRCVGEKSIAVGSGAASETPGCGAAVPTCSSHRQVGADDREAAKPWSEASTAHDQLSRD